MHVILTANYSPWSPYCGGGQCSTDNLAKALCRRGHEVEVVFTKPPWEGVDVPDGLPYRLHWATLPAVRSRRAAPLRPLTAFTVARAVRSRLRAGTVVHSQGEEGALLPRLRRRHRFTLVSTVRYPQYPSALTRKGSVSLWEGVGLLVMQGKHLMQAHLANHADACVPPSAFAADLVRRAYGVAPARLRVVHNGVPEEFLNYDCCENPSEGPLVFFGRYASDKGADTLVEALGQLGDAAPPSHFIGRGAEREKLVQRIRALGLDARLRPWMTHDELGEVLSSARIVALPSRDENFSLAILGAMAVGPPVISTHVGGTPEIIKDGETGLLVPPGNPEALADAIRHLVEHPGETERLGRAGRHHVRRHLTWDNAAERFEAIYEELSAFSSL